jgi:hypothetical protein
MVKQAFVPVLVAACSLVVLQGCKSDTAKDAKIEPVVLLEAGEEPRELLRYKLTDGTLTMSTLEVTTSSMATTTSAGSEMARRPELRIVISSGPAVSLPSGNTRYDVAIVNAEAIMPAGVDPQVQDDLNRSTALLKKVRGWIEVDDRGIIQARELNQEAKDADLPARMLISIINARTSFSRVMLPAEPVGIGAKWETGKELTMFGFKLNQVDRYTLTDKIGDEVRLDVEIKQTAPKQTLTFQEEGVEYALESLSMSAQGDVVLNLNALEASANAMGQSAEVMTVKTVEGTERIEVNTAMQLKMTVRQEASKKKAAAVEEEAKKAATGQE